MGLETEPKVSSPDKPKKRMTPTPAHTLARYAIEAILSKKGRDISVVDLHEVSGMADLFILCTGDSDLQIKAIADAVRQEVRAASGERPWHVEGYDTKRWVLLDYVDVVVHVFDVERRTFYDLERLWADAAITQIPDDATTVPDF